MGEGTGQGAQVLEKQLWLQDKSGWHWEWLIGQLELLTNYSVYAIQDGTRLSGPIYFTTKSSVSFSLCVWCVCVLKCGLCFFL